MNDFSAGYRAALDDIEYLLTHRIGSSQILGTLRALIAKHENNPEAIERVKRWITETQP